jgi:ribosomal protein L24
MANVYKNRLKKGDIVVVRAGKYKGKTGKIMATHPTLNKVTVEGVNIVKRHIKPTPALLKRLLGSAIKPMPRAIKSES